MARFREAIALLEDTVQTLNLVADEYERVISCDDPEQPRSE